MTYENPRVPERCKPNGGDPRRSPAEGSPIRARYEGSALAGTNAVNPPKPKPRALTTSIAPKAAEERVQTRGHPLERSLPHVAYLANDVWHEEEEARGAES